MRRFLNRRDEVLAVGPSAEPLLGAIDRAVRAEDPEVVVQPAGPGPWTAYYHGQQLVALVRPSVAGPAGAIDVSVPAVGWARTLSEPTEADDAELWPAMRDAMVARPRSPGLPYLPRGGGGAVEAIPVLIDVIAYVVQVVSRVISRRAADRTLDAAAGQGAVRVLHAARTEAFRRESSLSIGCVGAAAVFFLLLLLIVNVASFLANGRQLPWAGGAGFAGALVLSALVFRSIRKRYPSPPQSRFDRWGGRAVLGVLVLLAATIVVPAQGPSALPDEEVAWCLGSGTGYVDNAVRVLEIPRTWTLDSPNADPNFRKACGLAWDATHQSH
jgi:hypothetical protein